MTTVNLTSRAAPGGRRSFLRGALLVLAAGAAVLAPASTALAWDAHGHRLITLLALDHLSAGSPSFLREADTRGQIAENSTEPDRWRAVRFGQLVNVNSPDHYLDVEDLEAYGMTLREIPNLRNEFIAQLAIIREKAGPDFKGRPVNAARDTAKTEQWPGFIPFSVAENYGKLVASFKTLRMIEALADPARQNQVAAERGNIIAIMGVMSHYVGDIAQPLHTTRHHHGWVGDNPEGFTTAGSIHAYIDGGVLALHHLAYETLKGAPLQPPQIDPRDPWPEILGEIERSHAQVVPLYQMHKSGELDKDAGKQMITDRLLDGASMLAALYNAAWEASEPSQQDIDNFKKYDGTPESPVGK